MYCKNCGRRIPDNAVMCFNCHNAIQQPAPPKPKKKSQKEPNVMYVESNTVAIVGFVLAFFIPLVGFFCSIAGIAFAKEHEGRGLGLALAGFFISLFSFAVSIILLIAIIPL